MDMVAEIKITGVFPKELLDLVDICLVPGVKLLLPSGEYFEGNGLIVEVNEIE